MHITDFELIACYDGSSKFARLLSLSGAKGVRRVCNWRARAIPSAIKLAYPKVFKVQRSTPTPSTPAIQDT